MRRILAILGLSACLAGTGHAQQKVNPVTINPGGGSGGFSGGGINITVPQYGPTVIYGSPYGYNRYHHYGYGAVGVVAPGWSAPIPGYGGYGLGMVGNGGGAVYDDPLIRQQRYALNASRYNLANAQATKAYSEANYFQQQAIATAISNAQQSQALRERFNVRTATPRSRLHAPRHAPTVPLDELVSKEGAVLWPHTSPVDESRDRVDAAVAAIATQFRENGKATVQSVNEARQALQSYGQPALAKVRLDRPATAKDFKDFLNNLDASLAHMAK